MSVDGFSDAQILSLTIQAKPLSYLYIAAITLVIYDSFLLLPQECRHIYRGSQSLIKWIYVLIKLTGLFIFILNFLAYSSPHETKTMCMVKQWGGDFAFEIVYTSIIKTLLVLRLRALYSNNKYITIVLVATTAIEIMSTTFAFIMTGIIVNNNLYPVTPVAGCPLQSGTEIHHFRIPTIFWATRLASNGLELILLFVGLYRSLRDAGNNFRSGWVRMKQMAPILYVFYRDGTIFYIPVFALSLFGLVATYTRITDHLICANWEGWLALTYYIAGTRLILNIRTTGCKLTSSMMTQQVSTLAFEDHTDDSSLNDSSTSTRVTAETNRRYKTNTPDTV